MNEVEGKSDKNACEDTFRESGCGDACELMACGWGVQIFRFFG